MFLQSYNKPDILSVLESNNYLTYERPLELNIIGVRSSNRVTGRFDDVIHVCYKTNGNIWQQHIYPCTTDPGLYYLNHPINKSGTALLVQGQYREGYKLGLHQKKYKALVQNKPVKVYRSKDNNTDIDSKTGRTETGFFGINIHHASGTGTSEDVGRWSAGCQVIANIDNFREFIKLAESHAKLYGNQFTYTLLDYRIKGYKATALTEQKNNNSRMMAMVRPAAPQTPIPETEPPNVNPENKMNQAPLLFIGLTALLGIGTTLYFINSNEH
jgi:hypothetical protein